MSSAYSSPPLPAHFRTLCDAMGIGDHAAAGYGAALSTTERRSLERLVRAMEAGVDSRAVVRACLRVCGPRATDAVRGQAVVWCSEWHWVHGVPLDAADMPWPASTRLRLRMLTTCLNGGHVPPRSAWSWLCGDEDRPSCDAADAWAATWHDFAATMRSGTRPACTVPYCVLAGTRKADTLDAVLPDWRADRVRALFRCAWARCRRTGRETASRLEDKWWRALRGVFPGSEPTRHAPLPGTMHLDMFWPRERVALEIQGEPHWQSVGVFGGAKGFAQRQERDARKRALCAELGIRLVEVTRNTSVDDVWARLCQAKGGKV